MNKTEVHKKSLELLDEFLSATPKAELDALYQKHENSIITGPTLSEYFDYLDGEVGDLFEPKHDQLESKLSDNFIEIKVPDFHNKYDYSKLDLKDLTTFESLVFETKNVSIKEWIKIDHFAILDAISNFDIKNKSVVIECKNIYYPPDKKEIKTKKKDSAAKQSLFF